MRKIIFVMPLLLTCSLLFCQANLNERWQNPYTKKDGTYVKGHWKTDIDKTNHDNFSTQPIINRHTGDEGTKPRDYSRESDQYSSDKNIQTGPNGGQYYINSKGNKTYVPKTHR